MTSSDWAVGTAVRNRTVAVISQGVGGQVRTSRRIGIGLAITDGSKDRASDGSLVRTAARNLARVATDLPPSEVMKNCLCGVHLQVEGAAAAAFRLQAEDQLRPGDLAVRS